MITEVMSDAFKYDTAYCSLLIELNYLDHLLSDVGVHLVSQQVLVLLYEATLNYRRRSHHFFML